MTTLGTRTPLGRTPSFEALRAELRQKVKGTDIQLEVHRRRPVLRLTSPAGTIRVELVSEEQVVIEIKRSCDMRMTREVPRASAELGAWARMLAAFLVRWL